MSIYGSYPYSLFLAQSRYFSEMSDKPNDDLKKSAERVVEHNEKFNVPVQTEKEEAEGFENASPENTANEQEIRRKKVGLE
jgi:hypothetical protein